MYKKSKIKCYFTDSENVLIDILFKHRCEGVLIRKVIDIFAHHHIFIGDEYEFYGKEDDVEKALNYIREEDLDIEILD